MLPLLAQTSQPARPVMDDASMHQVIKDPGFAQWVVYLLVFLMVADKLKTWFGGKQPQHEITGSIETRPGNLPALKGDVEDVERDLDEVDTKVEGVGKSLGDLREHIDAKFDQQRVQASQRMRELQKTFSEEMQKVKQEIEHRISEVRQQLAAGITQATDKADTALQESAGHKASIDHLKAADYQHTLSLQAVNTRIDHLPATGRKPG